MEQQDFSDELRTRTRRQHDLSTTIVNLSAPLALSSPAVYRILLASWYWIYKTMEAEMEANRRRFPKVGAIYFRALLRTSAFEDDLRYYYGPDFAKYIEAPSPATSDYIRELKLCVQREPILIIAYCQTMYMAMFAGGAIVKKWIASAFAPPPGKGVSIFDFSDTIDDVRDFQKQYNDAINRIALTRQEKDKIIERKKKIFADNDTIFAELRSSRAYNVRVVSVIFMFLVAVLAMYLLIRILLDSTFRHYVISKASAIQVHS